MVRVTLPRVQFSKAAYRRPYSSGTQTVIDGGGRVTELHADRGAAAYPVPCVLSLAP
jgi:hypothetical protein